MFDLKLHQVWQKRWTHSCWGNPFIINQAPAWLKLLAGTHIRFCNEDLSVVLQLEGMIDGTLRSSAGQHTATIAIETLVLESI